MKATDKEKKAKEILRELGSVAVAYSGGVDSTLMSILAKETLDKHCISVIGSSPVDPAQELSDARKTARWIGIRLVEVDIPLFEQNGFLSNSTDRCYHCKKNLFEKIREVADQNDTTAIVDGSTSDDVSDFRPGMRAKKEFGVRSPLLEAGINKGEVRELLKKRGVDIWDKPQTVCLASRIPYGDRITREALDMIGSAEAYITKLGFKQVRVRKHGSIARIEIDQNQLEELLSMRKKIAKKLKNLGFTYITVDIEGFRSGSMNEVL